MWFVLFIAVVNFGLGYASAIYLLRGRVAAAAAMPPHVEPEASPEPPSQALPRPPVPEVKKTPDPEPLPVEPAPDSKEPPADETIHSEVEASIEEMRRELGRHCDQLVDLDQRVRENSDGPAEAMQGYSNELVEANRRYLQQQSKAMEQLDQCQNVPESLVAVAEEIKSKVVAHTEEVRASLNELDAWELNETSLAAYCEKLLSQTGGLLETSHMMRDSLDGALQEIARQEDRAPETKTREKQEGMGDRGSLELALDHWWHSDPAHRGDLSVALLDVDQLTLVNREYGVAMGDEIVAHLARTVVAARPDGGIAARLPGQQFMLLMPTSDPQQGTGTLERIRQTIEKTVFRHGQQSARITLSCAVVPVLAEDSVSDVIERAEMTIQEAKRYGRNRTFLYEGDYPTPIVPPTLTIEETVVEV